MQDFVALKALKGIYYRIPEQITLIRSSLKTPEYIPESEIAQLALYSQNTLFTPRQYPHNSTQFGELPNLIIRTQTFTRYEILNALADIEYDEYNIQRRTKGKAFIQNFSKALNLTLSFYKKQNNIIRNSNHTKESQVNKEIIEQFQVISKILSDRKNTFDIVQTQKELPLIDIAVFCYLKSIILNIPNSYPDYILRAAYQDLFKWHIEKQSQFQIVARKNKQKSQDEFQANKQQNRYMNELQSCTNINWKRFSISLFVAGVLYSIYAK